MIASNPIAAHEDLVGLLLLLVLKEILEVAFLLGEKILDHFGPPGSLIGILPNGVVVGGEAWHAAEVLLLFALWAFAACSLLGLGSL